MTLIAAKWTIDDYHQMIAAGILCDRQVELLKGEIVEMSPEGEPHVSIPCDCFVSLRSPRNDLP